MRPAYNAKAPKRPVTLCLNEDLVAQVRDVTNNLSGVVESLLADFVCKSVRDGRLIRRLQRRRCSLGMPSARRRALLLMSIPTL